MSIPRLLAGLLALGGSCWGLLLAPLIFRPETSPIAWAMFGPGYLITLAYFIRAASTPAIGARYLIWISSLLVQGAWLLCTVWDVIQKIAAGGSIHEPSLMSAWWLFATVASAVGLLTEKPDHRAPNAAP